MDENRYNIPDDENIGQGGDEFEKTQEIDSILSDFGHDRSDCGITPRDEFTDLNSADDMKKTLMMDSLGGCDDEDDFREQYVPQNPVKKRRKKRRKQQINHTRTMGQIFLGVLISVAAVCTGVVLAVNIIDAMRDFTGMAKYSPDTEVTVTEHMNVDDIADMLHDEGIIKMPWLFKTYVKFAKMDSGFLNGEFTVNAGMSYGNIVAALKTVKTYTETISIMIPEGATAKQVGELLEQNYVCRAKDFMEYYKSKMDKFDFEETIAENENRFNLMEGYLFPDTYEFYVIDDLRSNPDFDTSAYAKQAAEKMFANFESKITKAMKARMEELGLTLDQTIILASLIQKEGTNEENMSMISSVFHNRLADPVTFPQLQSDTTYTYIDECVRPYFEDGSAELNAIIAAYDTYSCTGLPAGAVCNPGLEAINAALYPAETDYYYFLASSDGVFYYAQTHDQHEQNIIDAALRGDN